jgi:hypothetical protein
MIKDTKKNTKKIEIDHLIHLKIDQSINFYLKYELHSMKSI